MQNHADEMTSDGLLEGEKPEGKFAVERQLCIPELLTMAFQNAIALNGIVTKFIEVVNWKLHDTNEGRAAKTRQPIEDLVKLPLVMAQSSPTGLPEAPVSCRCIFLAEARDSSKQHHVAMELLPLISLLLIFQSQCIALVCCGCVKEHLLQHVISLLLHSGLLHFRLQASQHMVCSFGADLLSFGRWPTFSGHVTFLFWRHGFTRATNENAKEILCAVWSPHKVV